MHSVHSRTVAVLCTPNQTMRHALDVFLGISVQTLLGYMDQTLCHAGCASVASEIFLDDLGTVGTKPHKDSQDPWPSQQGWHQLPSQNCGQTSQHFQNRQKKLRHLASCLDSKWDAK